MLSYKAPLSQNTAVLENCSQRDTFIMDIFLNAFNLAIKYPYQWSTIDFPSCLLILDICGRSPNYNTGVQSFAQPLTVSSLQIEAY